MKKFLLIFWVLFFLAFAILYFFYPGVYYKIKSSYSGPDTPYIHVPQAN